QTLLSNAGLGFDIDPAEIDERGIQQKSGLSSPGEIAAHLAREKSLLVSRRRSGHYVVGADQVLALGRRLLNKPADRAQAAEQIGMLAGRTHELYAAVAVARNGK